MRNSRSADSSQKHRKLYRNIPSKHTFPLNRKTSAQLLLRSTRSSVKKFMKFCREVHEVLQRSSRGILQPKEIPTLERLQTDAKLLEMTLQRKAWKNFVLPKKIFESSAKLLAK